ncbi:hypothetical protein [Nonomuraea thailandensis]|uniref:hypothetical protein n=1 Tax=Nonomuraea thailandensis TaxID=1188745 RepID=UPI003384C1A6
MWQFDCPGYLWTLQKAVTYASSSIEPTNGNRVFSAAATSGFIMQTLLGEAQARGALSGLTWTFNASTVHRGRMAVLSAGNSTDD